MRRLATQASLDDEEVLEICRMLYTEQGVACDEAAPTAISISANDLSGVGGDLPTTLLLAIKDAVHTNKLALGQTLPFAVEGFTIVYGDNGSGKSGYGRLLRGLCRARRDRAERILGDVYAQTSPPPAQVTVSFQTGNERRSVSWQDGTPPPAELCRISLFDASSAPLYADRQNQIEFLPQGLDVMPRLGAALVKLAALVDQDMQKLRVLTAVPLIVVPAETKAATLQQRLLPTWGQALPSEQSIREIAVWDESLEAQLGKLNAEIKVLEEPERALGSHKRAKNALEDVQRRIATAEEILTGCSADVVKNAISVLQAAEATAALAAKEQFVDDPFGQAVGTEPWRNLYEYAKQFSLLAYPGDEFPVVAPGSYCVLCQQPLQPSAVDRFQRFRTFIEGIAQQGLEDARRALAALATRLSKLQLPSTKELELQLAELLDLGTEHETVRDLLIRHCESLRAYGSALLQWVNSKVVSKDQYPVKPAQINENVAGSVTALQLAIDRFQAMQADKSQLQALQHDRDGLNGQQLLARDLEQLLTRRSQLERLRKLTSCRRACDTQAVSVKNNSLKSKYITEDFKRRISKETEDLGLSYLPLKIETRSERGNSFIGVALNKTGAEKASAVLSEGEFRCLAVACFLAEISTIPSTDGIILDDPVCSLDHKHTREVARRLVREAKTRQVIVFTHDLSFYYELWHAAMDEKVPVARHWVSISPTSGCGTVLVDAAPWQAKNVRERLPELEEKLKTIPEPQTCDAQAYQREVEEFYSRVRETWERLVEERLFNDVVGRFQPGVKTQSLSGVVVEDSDFEKIYRAMSKASNYSGHDRATDRRAVMPGKVEMKADLDELREYDKVLRRRSEETRKKRTVAVEEPAKAKMIF